MKIDFTKLMHFFFYKQFIGFLPERIKNSGQLLIIQVYRLITFRNKLKNLYTSEIPCTGLFETLESYLRRSTNGKFYFYLYTDWKILQMLFFLLANLVNVTAFSQNVFSKRIKKMLALNLQFVNNLF